MTPTPRPASFAAVVELVVGLADDLAPGHPVRLAVDGAPPTRPAALADALVDPLRVRGRPVIRLRAGDFLRPASVRLERGRTDPDALYEDALDTAALLREVLEPLGPGGSLRYLPSLWDADRDRATRAGYGTADPRAVLVVDGALLLRPPLRARFELAVHLSLSPAALARRTAAAERWALAAYERYGAEAAPSEAADVVVRMDDPRRPAVVVRG